MKYSYFPTGVCSRQINLELDDNGKITSCEFVGGCSGNTQGDFTSISCWENKQKSFSVGISLRLGKLSTSVKKTEKTIENEDVVGGIKQK